MFQIILVGAGQIGSRYLSGLAKINKKIKILVVEPIISSQKIAKQRWIEAGGEKSGHYIEYVNSLDHQNFSVDLAIIATSAFERSKLIHDVSLKTNPRYWVIEKIVAQSIQELNLIQCETTKAKGAWVNTPRRLMTWHQKLKNKFYDQGPLSVKLIGGIWGLACNSIHFIDLISWWTGESLLSIDTAGLDREWFKSKRPGYYEITGELTAKFSKGTVLILRSERKINKDIISVKLSNNDVWQINEREGKAHSSSGDILNGILEYQSDITGPMVNKIIEEGACNLPTIKFSSEQHLIFIDRILKHWNSSNNSNATVAPLT